MVKISSQILILGEYNLVLIEKYYTFTGNKITPSLTYNSRYISDKFQ